MSQVQAAWQIGKGAVCVENQQPTKPMGRAGGRVWWNANGQHLVPVQSLFLSSFSSCLVFSKMSAPRPMEGSGEVGR